MDRGPLGLEDRPQSAWIPEVTETEAEIGIVGAGRMGQALARRLAATGAPPGLLCSRSRSRAQSLAAELGWTAVARPSEVIAGSALTLLAVPDAELGGLALGASRDLDRGERLSPRVVAHCAGIQGIASLSPLQHLGCALGVFHPLAPVPDGDPSCLDDTFISIEAEPGARQPLLDLAARLACQTVEVADLNRPLYHVAAVFAGVLPVLLEGLAERLATVAGGEDELRAGLRALHLASARNVERLGPELALTGPGQRQDSGTIGAHIDALSRLYPALADLYISIQEAARQLPADPTGKGDSQSG
jgi:predicted short-subunit dehydrogenase-like oxidoreductase (DUF2520 family)